MTFEEWLIKEDPEMECSIHDCILDGDYKKAQDCKAVLEEAFEAGYNACLDELINGSDHSEWVEIHKGTLEGLKK